MRPLPEGLRYAETAAEEAGFEAKSGVVPKRWADDAGIVACIEAQFVRKRQEKEEGLAKLAEWKAVKAQETAHLPKRPRGRPKGSRGKKGK
jgi:hypothetical protein